jgi:general stress protein 26
MSDEERKFADLMRDMSIGMMTTYGPDGPRSIPMARQEVDPGADVWFITARDTQHVRDIGADPLVSITFSSRDSWVSMVGRAQIVEDQAKLEELWNTFAEAWMPAGPDDPNAALIKVSLDRAEYWDTPGGTVASVLSFVKSKVTGETFDAEHGTVTP